MNNPRWRAATGVLGAVCLCACWVAWDHRSGAIARRDAAEQSALVADQQLRELHKLRSRAAVVDHEKRPGDAMVSPFRAALEQAGMGAECLAGVALPDPQPIAEGQLARQEASLTLTGVRLADLGRVLVRWSEGQPRWTIRSIRLERSESTRAGTDNAVDRFTAVITVDNIHVNTRPAGGSTALRSARSGQ